MTQESAALAQAPERIEGPRPRNRVARDRRLSPPLVLAMVAVLLACVGFVLLVLSRHAPVDLRSRAALEERLRADGNDAAQSGAAERITRVACPDVQAGVGLLCSVLLVDGKSFPLQVTVSPDGLSYRTG